jgi:hypothetical protein
VRNERFASLCTSNAVAIQSSAHAITNIADAFTPIATAFSVIASTQKNCRCVWRDGNEPPLDCKRISSESNRNSGRTDQKTAWLGCNRLAAKRNRSGRTCVI